MLTLTRISFRQLLLVAFLLIASLLGAVLLRGLYTLEQLVNQAREGAQRAVVLSAEAQGLGELLATMERSARQYLVLDDTALRDRFEQAAKEAQATLERLEAHTTPELSSAWRESVAQVDVLLGGPRETAGVRELGVSESFTRLSDLHTTLTARVRRANEDHNRDLQAALDASRLQLGRQVLGAIAVALVLALVFGLWLARPLKRLERAIVGLGENRLDEPIEIRGPADVREVGRRMDWLRLRLADIDADKARFLRHVSHELKTPLAAMREGVSLFEDGVAGALTDNQREIVAILRQNTLVLQQQIEDLLRFNAAAFEARRLQREPTDLGELLKERIDEQRLQWQAKQLRVELSGRAPRLAVDRDKFGTAFRNLLSNAIRYSPVGASIQVRLQAEADRVWLDIVDEGPGISDADRSRVFEPFYRGEIQPAGAARGTGIGLSIVQEYVAAHGGRIEVLPNAPGAHFRIELIHAV
jgi:two-component system, NtrC family, sensor histidine kinase GlrK